MGFWSKLKTWIRRKQSGLQPHPRIRCPRCGSAYVRNVYSDRFECCDCGKIFS